MTPRFTQLTCDTQFWDVFGNDYMYSPTGRGIRVAIVYGVSAHLNSINETLLEVP